MLTIGKVNHQEHPLTASHALLVQGPGIKGTPVSLTDVDTVGKETTTFAC